MPVSKSKKSEGMKKVRIGGKEITLTHPDKIIFPQAGICKADLINYYRRIGLTMLPYLKNRPLTMHRFPQGVDAEGFYQKNIPDYFPSWIARTTVAKKEGGTVRYVVCNDLQTLVYLANQLCITPHVWLSTVGKKNYPDKMIFDLDPAGTASFSLVKWVARAIKKLAEQRGLVPFVMTTGSKGLHVTIPLERVHTFGVVRAYAQKIAHELADRYPERITLEMRKAKRGNRIFIDTLRNARGATAVAPYALRALPMAPVATPITWQELGAVKTAQKYTIKNIFKRLAVKADVWKEMAQSAGLPETD